MGEVSLPQMASTNSLFDSPAVPGMQIFSVSLTLYLSLENGNFIIDTGTFPLFLIILGTFLTIPLLTLAFSRISKAMTPYSLGIELFLYLAFILLFLREWFLLPLMAMPLILGIFKMNLKQGLGWTQIKILIFVGLSFLMYFLGSLIQFIVQPLSAPVSLVSLKDVYIFPGEPFPFLFYLGMNIYGSALTITFSPLTLIIFSVVAALVAENYEGFFTVLKGRNSSGLKSAVYGVTAALSCQCEACISLLPAMIFIIVSTTMVPLILESIFLLVLSSYFIRAYRLGAPTAFFMKLALWYRTREIIIAAFLVLIVTPVELLGLYLGWLHSPLFFFGISMLDTLSGYALAKFALLYLAKASKNILSVPLIAAGVAMSLSWYIPALTTYAFSSGIAFSLMAISGFMAGILFGIAHSTARNGYLVPEAVSLVYGIFVIIIFYITIDLRVNIWSEFPYAQTVIYEIISWALMLPIMWIFTQMALYSGNGIRDVKLHGPFWRTVI